MIEVWDADLSAPPLPDGRLAALLSPEELARCGRFHFERDRVRFLRRRAFRRLCLAARLGLAARDLEFRLGAHGKPAVAGAPEDFEFNDSGSGARALLATCFGGKVGVDLEAHRPFDEDLAAVIGRFAPDEEHQLLACDPVQRAPRFFECWVRKEAFVKAVGLGLHLPLESFSVPVAPDAVAAAVGWPGDPVSGRLWWVTSIELGVGWSAAVVSDRPDRVRRTPWSWR